MEIKLDTAFDRALRSAVQKGGNKPDAVYAALIDQLSLTETVPFTVSGLTSAGAGRQALDVIFESGVNPNAAANNAVTRWLGVLRYLPESGRYIVRMSMTDASGGFILAIDVEVDQPGSGGSSSSSDDDDDENGGGSAQQKSYTVSTDLLGKTTYTVHLETGLQDMVDDLTKAGKDPSEALVNADIILECDVTLTKEWKPIGCKTDQYGAAKNPYTGTFDGEGHTISGLVSNGGDSGYAGVKYAGIIGVVGKSGVVQNLVVYNPQLNGTIAGGVAAGNTGTVKNCLVVGGTINGSMAAGGVVGTNGYADESDKVGGKIISCGHTGGTTESGNYSGGLVGGAGGTVQMCFHANGTISGDPYYTGGVIGYGEGVTVINCYWNGPLENGIGEDSEKVSGNATKVDGESVTWKTVVEKMGGAWTLGSDGLPTLK